MSTISTLARNSFAILATRLIIPICSFVLIPFIARSLGTSGLGKYSLVLSIFIIFQEFATLGLSPYITREVAKDRTKANKYLSNSFSIGLLSSLSFIAIMIFSVRLLHYGSDVTLAFYIISGALLCASLGIYCDAIFTAFEKMQYIAYVYFLENIGRISLSIYFLAKGYGFISLIIIITIMRFLALLLAVFFITKYIRRIQWEFDLGFCKKLVKNAPIFAFIAVFSTIYWQADIIMISKIKTIRDVGIYAAAYKLMAICKIIPLSLTLSLFPVMSRFFKSSPALFQTTCTASLKYLLMAVIPIALGTTLLADRFVPLFYGNKFLSSIPTLQILIWTIVPFSLVMLFANILIASDHQKIDLRINIIGVVINIALNLLLIPRFSYLGASAATLISVIIFSYLQYSFISHHIFKIKIARLVIKPLISALLMGLFILLFKQFNLALLIGVSVAIYLLALICLKAISKRDREIMLNSWNGLIRGEN